MKCFNCPYYACGCMWNRCGVTNSEYFREPDNCDLVNDDGSLNHDNEFIKVEYGGKGRMREVLFRGKRKDNGEWVYGFYVKHREKSYIYTGNVECVVLPIYVEKGTKYEVDSETVCQYTGLTDKNDRKVFEGDIVGRYSEYNKKWNYGIVKYGAFNCSCCEGVYGWYFDGEDIRNAELYEVRGNIFDNPDLC